MSANISDIRSGLNEAKLNKVIENSKVDISKEIKIDTKALYESASKYFDNSEKAKTRLSILEKVSTSRNIEIKFYDRVTSDGIYVTRNGKRAIVLNPNSNRAVEFSLMHELGHDLEGQKLYEDLKQIILDYDKGKAGFEEARANLTEIYTNYYKENNLDMSKLNIDNEAVNDILGQMLGDQKFINKLSMEKPNLFQKIVNWLDNKIELFKSTDKDHTRFLQEVRGRFEEAYRNNEKTQESNNNSMLFSVNPNFGKEYDNWNKTDRNGKFLLGKVSGALQSIGLKNNDIYMDKSKIMSIKNKHIEMTDDIIKQIPDILEKPIVVLKSSSSSNENNNRLVLFGEIFSNNKPIMVALEIDPAENINSVDKIYKVASAYGKQNISTIQKWLSNINNYLYFSDDTKKTTKWFNGLGLQLPVPLNQINGFVKNNVSQFSQNVKHSISEETTSSKFYINKEIEQQVK